MANVRHAPQLAWVAVITVGVVLTIVAAIALAHRVPTPTNAGTIPGSPLESRAAAASTQTPPAGKALLTNVTSPSVTRSSATTGLHTLAAARRADATTTAREDRAPSIGTPPPATSKPVPLITAAMPSTLTLPTLDVTADVLAVQNIDGALQVPQNPLDVGWWTDSALPGSVTGTTVIDGHIDSAASGEGALFHLARLSPGDAIEIRTTTGETVNYQVQARRVYVKAQGLPAAIFAATTIPRLVLISCGGPFDSTTHSYQDNIVIYAVPTHQAVA